MGASATRPRYEHQSGGDGCCDQDADDDRYCLPRSLTVRSVPMCDVRGFVEVVGCDPIDRVAQHGESPTRVDAAIETLPRTAISAMSFFMAASYRVSLAPDG